MPPVIDTTRDIWYLDYTVDGNAHTVQYGVVPGTPNATVLGFINNVVTTLVPYAFVPTVYQGVRKKAAGTNFSIDQPFSSIDGSNLSPIFGENQPRFVSAVGRSDAGKRCRQYYYGLAFVEANDYRLDPADDPLVQDLLDVIATGIGFLVAVGGNGITWKNYLNWGYNSYHQRQQRNA